MPTARNLQRDGQDFEFVVSVPMINGEPFDLENNDWDISICGSEATATVEYRSGAWESVGSVQANAEIVDGNVAVYCKSSKCPFGVGNLQIEMTIYAPHEKFEDEIQVLKTLRDVIDIFLV